MTANLIVMSEAEIGKYLDPHQVTQKGAGLLPAQVVPNHRYIAAIIKWMLRGMNSCPIIKLYFWKKRT